MDAANRHVVGDEVALAKKVVMLDHGAATEIHFDDGQDLPPPFCPRPARRGMINHVCGHKVVDGTVVTLRQATEQLLNQSLGVTHLRGHERMMPGRGLPAPAQDRHLCAEIVKADFDRARIASRRTSGTSCAAASMSPAATRSRTALDEIVHVAGSGETKNV
jgi:hypothetical protein